MIIAVSFKSLEGTQLILRLAQFSNSKVLHFRIYDLQVVSFLLLAVDMCSIQILCVDIISRV